MAADKIRPEKRVIIAGGGPAGLFCAYCLVKAGITVDLYDQMEKPGRKFILAGVSGLNITNSENFEQFVSRYGKDESLFRQLLLSFSPSDLVKWYNSLGVETFTGNAGRVFAKTPGADLIVDKWKSILDSSGIFSFYGNHRLLEILQDKTLVFETAEGKRKTVKTDFAVFALGGASWPATGSDGRWSGVFSRAGITVIPFRPANCGFETGWSEAFKARNADEPLKNIKMTHNGKTSRGELVIKAYGIEGSGIYMLASSVRDAIESSGKTIVEIDLLPDLSAEEIRKRIDNKPAGKNTISNYLRKTFRMPGVKYSLLKELLPGRDLSAMIKTSPEILKSLKLPLLKTRPLEEAISTSGGVSIDSVDSNLMLKSIPGFYVTGEMVDWEAPTGGYMLQGCFSSAYRAASCIIMSLRKPD